MRRRDLLSKRFSLAILSLIAIAALLTVAALPELPVGRWYVIGPVEVARLTGKPMMKTVNFSVLNPETQYTLVVYNGGVDGQYKKMVSSAVIWLNGKVVVAPRDFNQNVQIIKKDVKLKLNNKLTVQLRSAPKSGLTLAIIGVDEVPPTIVAQATPPANANGWNNTDVTVHFICNDTISGIAYCSPDEVVTQEGQGIVVTGTAIDKARNQATTSITLNIDKTPPMIQAAISPAPTSFGWNNTDVTVSFTCTDNLSGLDPAAPCPSPVTVTAEGETPLSYTIADLAGNSSTLNLVVRIDRTLPSITMTSPVAGETINAPTLKIAGTVSDDRSGVASVTCTAGTASAAAVISGTDYACELTPTAGTLTIEAAATDRAGNTATISTAGVIFSPPPSTLKKRP